jgi:hypothetical protein
VAPFVFTKIMRVVLRFMRAMKVRGTNCIDDNLWAEQPSCMAEVRHIVLLTFSALGWSFNEKCELTPSTRVIYNGMWIDSACFEIRAPVEKLERAMAEVCTALREVAQGRWPQLITLQRLTGRLQSLKLALEGVPEFTRGLYSDMARVQDEAEAAGLRYANGSTRVQLRPAAMVDLLFWRDRLYRQNGLPIRDEGSEIHLVMRTDASDLGWGAHLDGRNIEAAGMLPHATLGDSSTLREVAGVLLAAEQLKEHLRGRRVRILMDSYPALCNLIKGGGPIEAINALVREWWLWCRRYAVKPLYRWVPREENAQADELSKQAATSLQLRPQVEGEVREWLVEQGLPGVDDRFWRQTKLHVPLLGSVAARIEEMRRSRQPACITVPRWESQAWWPRLGGLSLARRKLGTAASVLLWDEKTKRMWSRTARNTQMEAHVLLIESKRDRNRRSKGSLILQATTRQ